MNMLLLCMWLWLCLIIVWMFLFIELRCMGMCGVFVIRLLLLLKIVYEKLSCFLMFIEYVVFCSCSFICLVIDMNRLLKILSCIGLVLVLSEWCVGSGVVCVSMRLFCVVIVVC